MIYKFVHKNLIREGDLILHDGLPRTVCQKDIKRSLFMGVTIFGDSYNLGYKLVKKITKL